MLFVAIALMSACYTSLVELLSITFLTEVLSFSLEETYKSLWYETNEAAE